VKIGNIKRRKKTVDHISYNNKENIETFIGEQLYVAMLTSDFKRLEQGIFNSGFLEIETFNCKLQNCSENIVRR